jgi:hygromycin-B 7''-O-kinase
VWDEVLPPGSVVTEVLPRTGGQLSTVVEVRLAGADPLIVKRYSDEWRWKQPKEVHVYRLLADAGVGPAPRVVRVDYERAVTVLTLVPGTPMSQRTLDTGTTRAAYRRIGAILAAMHRIPMPAYGYVTTGILDPAPDNPTYMRRQFARHLAEFAARGGPPDLHDAVRARVAAGGRAFGDCSRAVLCHNDLHEGNVLVDASGVVTGVIDVENAVAADPLLDVAKTIQYDLDASPVKRAGLLEGYGPLPPSGEERVALYRLYHALELWVFFASTGNTAPLPSIAGDMRSLAAGSHR